MSKVIELNTKALAGKPLAPEEAIYLCEVLSDMLEALVYTQKHSLYFKEPVPYLKRVAEVHKGTVVGAAANLQLKVRHAIQRGGGE